VYYAVYPLPLTYLKLKVKKDMCTENQVCSNSPKSSNNSSKLFSYDNHDIQMPYGVNENTLDYCYFSPARLYMPLCALPIQLQSVSVTAPAPQ